MAHVVVRGTVYKRCGCRDSVTGKRKGPGCDQLPRPGHGSWYVSLEMPAGVVGERRRLRLGSHRSRQHAELALRALQTPCPATGTAAWTTGRWLRHWLAGRVSLRPSTRRMYESHLRLYLLPHLDRIPLAALTILDVRATFLAINRQHQPLAAPLSATTLHSIRCTLRAALNAAIREGLLTDNPARWIELPAHRRPHAVVWTRARVAAWKAGGPVRRSRFGPPRTPPGSWPPSRATSYGRCSTSSRCAGCGAEKQPDSAGPTSTSTRQH